MTSELRRRAEDVLAYRNFADNAKFIAQAVLQLLDSIDAAATAQERITSLEEAVRNLKAAIEKIAAAGPSEREKTIASALTAARGIQ